MGEDHGVESDPTLPQRTGTLDGFSPRRACTGQDGLPFLIAPLAPDDEVAVTFVRNRLEKELAGTGFVLGHKIMDPVRYPVFLARAYTDREGQVNEEADETAREAGPPVGAVALDTSRLETTHAVGISWATVVFARRGNTVGRQLLQHAEQYALSLGADNIQAADGAGGTLIFRRLGYTRSTWSARQRARWAVYPEIACSWKQLSGVHPWEQGPTRATPSPGPQTVKASSDEGSEAGDASATYDHPHQRSLSGGTAKRCATKRARTRSEAASRPPIRAHSREEETPPRARGRRRTASKRQKRSSARRGTASRRLTNDTDDGESSVVSSASSSSWSSDSSFWSTDSSTPTSPALSSSSSSVASSSESISETPSLTATSETSPSEASEAKGKQEGQVKKAQPAQGKGAQGRRTTTTKPGSKTQASIEADARVASHALSSKHSKGEGSIPVEDISAARRPREPRRYFDYAIPGVPACIAEGSVKVRMASADDKRPWNSLLLAACQYNMGGSSMMKVTWEAACRIVAYPTANPREVIGLVSMQRSGWISFIACDAARRSAGLGSFLLFLAMEWLRVRDGASATLTPLNHKVISFYRRWGFDAYPAEGRGRSRLSASDLVMERPIDREVRLLPDGWPLSHFIDNYDASDEAVDTTKWLYYFYTTPAKKSTARKRGTGAADATDASAAVESPSIKEEEEEQPAPPASTTVEGVASKSRKAGKSKSAASRQSPKRSVTKGTSSGSKAVVTVKPIPKTFSTPPSQQRKAVKKEEDSTEELKELQVLLPASPGDKPLALAPTAEVPGTPPSSSHVSLHALLGSFFKHVERVVAGSPVTTLVRQLQMAEEPMVVEQQRTLIQSTKTENANDGGDETAVRHGKQSREPGVRRRTSIGTPLKLLLSDSEEEGSEGERSSQTEGASPRRQTRNPPREDQRTSRA